MILFLFYSFGLITILSALAVICFSNPVYSGLCLVACFFSLGVIYILMNQEFFAVIQILIYAGAIMVLFLFIIMLLDLSSQQLGVTFSKLSILIACVVGFFIFKLGTILYNWKNFTVKKEYTLEKIEESGGIIEVIGELLYTHFLLPFEMISLLLFVAIIGAVLIAKKKYHPN